MVEISTIDSTVVGHFIVLSTSQVLKLGNSVSHDDILRVSDIPFSDIFKVTFRGISPEQAVVLRKHLGNVLRKLVFDWKYEDLLGYDTKLFEFFLKITMSIEEYVTSIGYDVDRYVLGVYATSEEEELYELRPYIEVHMRIQDVKMLITLWRNCLKRLAELFGEQIFQHVSVFLTRAV